MKRDFKRVMGEGKFVLTGGLVVARYRLAFVAEVIGFTISKALRRRLSAGPLRDLKRFIS